MWTTLECTCEGGTAAPGAGLWQNCRVQFLPDAGKNTVKIFPQCSAPYTLSPPPPIGPAETSSAAWRGPVIFGIAKTILATRSGSNIPRLSPFPPVPRILIIPGIPEFPPPPPDLPAPTPLLSFPPPTPPSLPPVTAPSGCPPGDPIPVPPGAFENCP